MSDLFVFESVFKVRNDVIFKGFPHLEDCNSSGIVMKQRKDCFFGLQLLESTKDLFQGIVNPGKE